MINYKIIFDVAKKHLFIGAFLQLITIITVVLSVMVVPINKYLKYLFIGNL